MNRKGQLRIGAIYRAARSIRQMPHPGLPTAFEEMQEAHEITLDIGMRVGEGVAHPGLGREMDHPLRRMTDEHVFHALSVRQVEPHECKLFVSAELG